ncbi:MAG: 2-amino-4-hydroxy-6-hydroxymethyldihydropteridine diphosphokinase [Rhodospirillaceae bacterium]
MSTPVLIALGGNLPSWVGEPRTTCEAALAALEDAGVRILQRSSWYSTAPVPVSDQPWFVNGVVAAETGLDPAALLALLHSVEAAFGRERAAKNGARTLDLDLLAYGDQVSTAESPLLPHPRLQDRAFVLIPLVEIAPAWRHPVLGTTARELLDLRPVSERAGVLKL